MLKAGPEPRRTPPQMCIVSLAHMRMRLETKQAVSWVGNGLRLAGREFMDSFRNFCFDPPVDMLPTFCKMESIRKLLDAA
jgi:hypothetical protein